jgi:hypothetical protein
MSTAMVGPDGLPPQFDGASWISADGRYWWNGAAWQPVRRPGFRPNYFVLGMAVIVVAVCIFAVQRILFNTAHPEVVPMGITNARIDSPTQIEFDYARSASCAKVSFTFQFFDKAGSKVGDDLASEGATYVPGNKTIHFTEVIVTGQIPTSAVRFSGVAICQG